jgi:hypothetical protein
VDLQDFKHFEGKLLLPLGSVKIREIAQPDCENAINDAPQQIMLEWERRVIRNKPAFEF